MLRLYLDTADLISIADGKADEATVSALHEAMKETGTALLISLNHPWDFYERSDAPTRERMIRAINAFPMVEVAVVEPLKFERQPDGPVDIELAPCAEIREVLEHQNVAETLRTLYSVSPVVQQAEQAGVEAQRCSAGKLPRKADIERSVRLAAASHSETGSPKLTNWRRSVGSAPAMR